MNTMYILTGSTGDYMDLSIVKYVVFTKAQTTDIINRYVEWMKNKNANDKGQIFVNINNTGTMVDSLIIFLNEECGMDIDCITWESVGFEEVELYQ